MPPDNVRPPPKPKPAATPSLLAARLMTEIHELLRDRHRGMRNHRVVYRVNDRGEQVISLVLPPQG